MTTITTVATDIHMQEKGEAIMESKGKSTTSNLVDIFDYRPCIEIAKGNFYYGRCITGYDILFVINEEVFGYYKQFAYRIRLYKRTDIVKSCISIPTPVQFDAEPLQIDWYKNCDDASRKALYNALIADGVATTEGDMPTSFYFCPHQWIHQQFLYKWADEHLVYNRDITLDILKELGKFENVHSAGQFTQEFEGRQTNMYIVTDNNGSSWLVKVQEHFHPDGKPYHSFSIEKYDEFLHSRKSFGDRCRRLADEANVPWEIAVLVGRIADDEKAISLLKAVSCARRKVNDYIWQELEGGMGQRDHALQILLGGVYFELTLGPQQTKTLANYLLGR